MKELTIIFICIIFFNLNLFSQSTLIGQVLDQKSFNAIPFSLIRLSKINIQSISNEDGFFSFNIVDLNLDDTITVSSLGYSTKKFTIAEMLKNRTNKFYLLETPINLSEVSVQPINVVSLLNNATKVSSFKFQLPILLNGYYREVVKTDTSISKYADGLISYYLQRDKKTKVEVLTKINQSRLKEINLDDDDRFDGLESKIPVSKLAEFIEPISASILDSNNFKYYDYQIQEVNEGTIYVIKFKPKPNTNTPLYQGVIEIDKMTNFILSIEYKFSPTPNFKVLKNVTILGMSVSITDITTIVKYNLENENYFPIYVYKRINFSTNFKKISQTNEVKSEFITVDFKNEGIVKPIELFKKKYLYQNGNKFTYNFWEYLNINPNSKQINNFLKD